jgi:D-amino-acid dehydrogenase
VIGLTTAQTLQAAGHEVVLMEARSGVGEGASYANAAQLSYGYVAPFASPDVLTSLPNILLSPESAVRLRLRADRTQWKWLARFLAACTRARTLQSTQRLLQLAALSRTALSRLEVRGGPGFSHLRTGKLVMYATARAFAKAVGRMRYTQEHGPQRIVMTPDDCFALDPFLLRLRGLFVGAIFTPTDETADCYAFCRALHRHITGTGAPAAVFLSTRIDRIVIKDGRAIAVESPSGRVEADAIVMANGVEAVKLAQSAGLQLPIYPIKGYSVTVDAPRSESTAAVSVTHFERRIVFAPLGQRLRIAGLADLVGNDTVVDPRRVSRLLAFAREITGNEVSIETASPWAGLRPSTPNGLPIIGATPVRGLFVNAGHGAFGFTLAMGSAALLASAIAGEPTGYDLARS